VGPTRFEEVMRLCNASAKGKVPLGLLMTERNRLVNSGVLVFHHSTIREILAPDDPRHTETPMIASSGHANNMANKFGDFIRTAWRGMHRGTHAEFLKAALETEAAVTHLEAYEKWTDRIVLAGTPFAEVVARNTMDFLVVYFMWTQIAAHMYPMAAQGRVRTWTTMPPTFSSAHLPLADPRIAAKKDAGWGGYTGDQGALEWLRATVAPRCTFVTVPGELFGMMAKFQGFTRSASAPARSFGFSVHAHGKAAKSEIPVLKSIGTKIAARRQSRIPRGGSRKGAQCAPSRPFPHSPSQSPPLLSVPVGLPQDCSLARADGTSMGPD
jgi:hypothetical protein